ncbi:MAG: YHS domain-containing (seleno)protein [Chryseolinea sp.]
MKKLFFISLFVIHLSSLYAQSSEVYKTDDGAIQGYDPVAYFKARKAVRGEKQFTYQWNDASWFFSSKANLDEFKANPNKFAPQYGGYCAYGTSEGHKAPTQPNAWTIVDDKLYLNYNDDVKTMWTKDRKSRIEKADKNWPAVKKAE